MNFGIFEITRRKKARANLQEERGYSIGGLSFNSLSSYSSTQAMRLSAVYAAVNQISNSVALLPLDIYKTKNGKRVKNNEHPLYTVLNGKPNTFFTHFGFMKIMTESVMLRGEAFALIERNEDLKVKALHYIPSENVTVVVKANGEVKYIVNGLPAAVDSFNMIHVYQHLDINTYRGISIIDYASRTLSGSAESEKHNSNFFRSGANLNGILKVQATLTKEQKEQIKTSWQNAFTNNDKDVSVAVLPQGVEYQPISVNAKDAQLLETRQYNVIEIARFFNISPVKLFDLTNSSYATLEQTQLSYIQDTVMPYAAMFKEEFKTKLFTPSEQAKHDIEFNFEALLEGDKDTQAKYYKTLLVNGIMTLNEVRERLDLEKVDDGDNAYMQLNMTTVKNIAEGANLKTADLDNKFKIQDDNKDNKDINTDKDNDKDNQ